MYEHLYYNLFTKKLKTFILICFSKVFIWHILHSKVESQNKNLRFQYLFLYTYILRLIIKTIITKFHSEKGHKREHPLILMNPKNVSSSSVLAD